MFNSVKIVTQEKLATFHPQTSFHIFWLACETLHFHFIALYNGVSDLHSYVTFKLSAKRSVKRKAKPSTPCKESPLQQHLHDLMSSPSKIHDICRGTEDYRLIKPSNSRLSARLAIHDPVFSLHSEMVTEHQVTYERIREIVAKHMTTYSPKLVTEKGDLCKITAAVLSFSYVYDVSYMFIEYVYIQIR